MPILKDTIGKYPCGDENQGLSMVSECYISLQHGMWWISAFYWLQVFAFILFVVFLIIAVRSMPARREAIT